MNLKRILLIVNLGFTAIIAFHIAAFANDKPIDSLKTALRLSAENEKAALLNQLSSKYWKIKSDSSLFYAKEALSIATEFHDSVNLAGALHNIGRYYYIIGENDKAIEAYFKSLKICEQIEFQKGIGQACNSIGLAYWRMEDLEKAAKYINDAKKYFEQVNDKDLLASSINNLGIIAIRQKKHTAALAHFKESYSIVQALKNYQKIAVRQSNIGYTYEMLGDYDKAMLYYNYSYRLADSLDSEWDKANVLINIGSLNHKMNNTTKAIGNLNNALKLAKKINAKQLQQESLKQFYQLYKDLGNNKKALDYHEQYTLIRDSILNDNKNQQIVQLQAYYENEKKENEIQLLQHANEIALLEKKKQENFIFFIIALAILITVILIFVYIRYSIKRHMNQLLETRNEEISRKNLEIKKQAGELLKTNEELKLQSIAAGKTHNAIILLDTNYDIEWINQGFTRMFGFTLDELKKERGKNLLEISGNPKIYQKLKQVLFDKKTIIYESQNIKKNGDKIWVQTTITPIIDEHDNVSRLIAVDSDISKLKKAEKEIIHQRDEIALQKKEITDSIIYSKRIQNAILTSSENISQIIPESFSIYIPKEIIGGDFYWMKKIGQQIIIAVADCTGHGVPGALMSMLGITLLNEIVEKKGITTPGKILDELRNEIIRILHQTDQEGSNDGMDIALCNLNPKTSSLKFAGANNPLLIANQERILELKPDKMPVSLYYRKEKPFFTQEVELAENDMIYMYTDGFVDQFGGEDGKKFFKSNLFQLIKKISAQNTAEQKVVFESTFYSWKGDEPQLDDVAILGFRNPSGI